MRLKKTWNQLLQPKKITVVSIEIDSNGYWNACIGLYLKAKNNIEALKEHEITNDTDEIFSLIEKKIPCSLIIKGKGILIREGEIDPDVSLDQLLVRSLPNADPNDYYLSEISSAESTIKFSIARKTIIDGILQGFKEKQVAVINLFIGASPSTDKELLNINEDCSELIMTANAILLKQISLNDIAVPLVIDQYQEYRYGRIFKLSGTALLVCCLIALLINFLLFDHFNKKYASLSAQAGVVNTKHGEIKKLQHQLQQKQNLLNKSGLGDVSRVSLYIDQIASTVPTKLKLSKVTANPEKKGLRSSDLDFDKARIDITGITPNGEVLNYWINKLRELQWIKNIEISEYDLEAKSQYAGFILQLQL
jgi:Tfp pilus assembly protein PilN